MRRRDVLEAVGAALVPGATFVSGCLRSPAVDPTGGLGDDPTDGATDRPTDEPATTGTPDEIEWRHGVGGSVDVVTRDAVFGREDFTAEGADGGVFALDAETGKHLWTYGESGGYTAYTPPTVADAVYVGKGDDAIGSGSGELYALEFDGTERWTRSVGSVYSRPRVVDGVVYVAGDDGVVRAFDAIEGEERWRNDDVRTGATPDLGLVAVDDIVIVATGGLVGLERDDGEERWRYGDGDDRIRGATVVDGVAYTATGEGVAAVEDGEERWHVPFESNTFVLAVTTDRVLVRHGWDLHALDVDDGEERWLLDDVERMRVDVSGDVVYVGGDRLYALDAADGTERWSTTVDGGRVETVAAVGGNGSSADEGEAQADGGGSAAGHVVYVQAGDAGLYGFDAEGEETWTGTVDGRIRSVLVDRFVFAGTDEGVYALDPR